MMWVVVMILIIIIVILILLLVCQGRREKKRKDEDSEMLREDKPRKREPRSQPRLVGRKKYSNAEMDEE